MSQLEVPAGIEHLDFEPEKEEEKEEEPHHHRHPTMPAYSWCGQNRKEQTFMEGNGRPTATITCPRCLALIGAFGISWYWATHRKHYGSNCTSKNGVIYHDCGV